MTTPLDPVIAQIIPLLPLRDPATLTPQSARDSLRALAAARAAVAPPEVASVADIQLKGAAGPVAARVYRVSAEKSPTIVFFHGGGWVAGDLETHDRQARLLAIETGAVVVSVDYRRPPETRFPGAFEDAFAAMRGVLGDIAAFGGDIARLGVAGDSAGGNLAASVAMALRDRGIDGVRGMALIYPMLGAEPQLPARDTEAHAPMLSLADVYAFRRLYWGGRWDERHDDTAALAWTLPLHAGRFDGLPRTLAIGVEHDPLRDDARVFAERGQARDWYTAAGVRYRQAQPCNNCTPPSVAS
jgi:acetyl esterase